MNSPLNTASTSVVATAAAVTAADFSDFMLEETTRLELELPNGEPMLFNGAPVAVNLYGPATKEYASARAELDKESASRVFRAMGNRSSKKKGGDEDREADAKFLTAVTASFENFPFPGGAFAIYREPKFKYIGNQVQAHINDLGNFFKASKKS